MNYRILLKQMLLMAFISPFIADASSIYIYNGLYGRKATLGIGFRNNPKQLTAYPLEAGQHLKIGSTDNINDLKNPLLVAVAHRSAFGEKSKEHKINDLLYANAMSKAETS